MIRRSMVGTALLCLVMVDAGCVLQKMFGKRETANGNADLSGDNPVRFVNESASRLRDINVQRKGPDGQVQWQDVLGDGELLPGAARELKLAPGTYTLSFTGDDSASGWEENVNLASPKEVVFYDDREKGPSGSAPSGFGRIAVVNSQSPDETQMYEVVVQNACPDRIEIRTRNWGVAGNGHGAVAANGTSEAMTGYAQIGMIRPDNLDDVWIEVPPGKHTVRIHETCRSLDLVQ